MMYDMYHGMWNFWIIGLILLLVLAIYVANDALRFGENGLLWGLVVLFMPMMGIFIYLIVRSTWNRAPMNTQYPSNMRYQPQSSPPRRETVARTMTSPVNSGQVDNIKGEGVQFCTSCGSENYTSSSYCNSCGARILASGV